MSVVKEWNRQRQKNESTKKDSRQIFTYRLLNHSIIFKIHLVLLLPCLGLTMKMMIEVESSQSHYLDRQLIKNRAVRNWVRLMMMMIFLVVVVVVIDDFRIDQIGKEPSVLYFHHFHRRQLNFYCYSQLVCHLVDAKATAHRTRSKIVVQRKSDFEKKSK